MVRRSSAAILLSIVLLLAGCGGASSMMLGAYLEDHEAELAIPADPNGDPVRLTVEPGTPAKAIGAMLQSEGLIGDELLFEAYVRVNNLATKLEAGTFVLSPAMSMIEIVDELQNAMAQGIVITVREGWRLEQVADFLAAGNVFSDTVAGVSPQADLYEQIALTGALGESIDAASYPFLAERPEGASLEGYLFPNSYELDKDDPQATRLIEAQLDSFTARVLPLYEQARAAGATQMTLHEVLTLASISSARPYRSSPP